MFCSGGGRAHLTSAVEVLVVPVAVVRLLPPIPLVPRAVRPCVVARLEPLLVRVIAGARARAGVRVGVRVRVRVRGLEPLLVYSVPREALPVPAKGRGEREVRG